ncbi:MAG TPA: hypothetical protein VHS80_17440, partial [Chthoniobacterales bacterium]|nr:hypothetical protein [Chthoniobacterales bacterium]
SFHFRKQLSTTQKVEVVVPLELLFRSDESPNFSPTFSRTDVRVRRKKTFCQSHFAIGFPGRYRRYKRYIKSGSGLAGDRGGLQPNQVW